MAINFDKIPTDKPTGFELPAEGYHKATITKAEITTSAKGNEYMQVTLKLDSGQLVWDNIMDTNAPAIQYKLGRFIQACGIPLVGELSFQDLASLVVDKEVVVDIKVKMDEYTDKQGNKVEKEKAEVDMFENDIYYPISAYASLVGEQPEPSNDDNITGVY